MFSVLVKIKVLLTSAFVLGLYGLAWDRAYRGIEPHELGWAFWAGLAFLAFVCFIVGQVTFCCDDEYLKERYGSL